MYLGCDKKNSIKFSTTHTKLLASWLCFRAVGWSVIPKNDSLWFWIGNSCVANKIDLKVMVLAFLG